MTRNWRCLGSNFTVDDPSLPVWWKFTFPQRWRSRVPGIGEEMRTQATWPDSESWDPGVGLRQTPTTVKMDVIFRAFNWPCEQILLATESGSGNVGYPPTCAILQVTQIWRRGQSCGSAGPGKPPTYAPTPRHVAVPFPTITGSSEVFWITLSKGPTWSSLSSSREEFRLSLPMCSGLSKLWMRLGRNRTQGLSELSVRDWALDLVLIQGTEPN